LYFDTVTLQLLIT